MAQTKVGLAADRPNLPSRGKRYIAKDTNQEWVGDGTDWIETTGAGAGGGGSDLQILQLLAYDSGSAGPASYLQMLLYPGEDPAVTWEPVTYNDVAELDGGGAVLLNEDQEVLFVEAGVYRVTWSMGVAVEHPTADSANVYAVAMTTGGRRFGYVQEHTVSLNGFNGVGVADLSGTGVAVVSALDNLRLTAGVANVDVGDYEQAAITVRGGDPGTRLTIERLGDVPSAA